MNETCTEHSGCMEAIRNLKHSDSKQWEELEEVRSRMDSIMTRLNVILGGIVVALIMLLLNVVFKFVQ